MHLKLRRDYKDYRKVGKIRNRLDYRIITKIITKIICFLEGVSSNELEKRGSL